MNQNLYYLTQEYEKFTDECKGDSVPEFVENFIYGSMEYNDVNLPKLTEEMSKQAQNKEPEEFKRAFDEMLLYLRDRFVALDPYKKYWPLHYREGVSAFVAMIDGLVVQYFSGLYSVDDLKERTPLFAAIILNGFNGVNEKKYSALSSD
ncbi:hypothetical protein [Pseudalkalibacillus hwajinpoensis]|uniref:TetR/AcrR family transcriptional regulator n=1 Tax=Guptibacillus hwajinpoensis TaxID=208199 RepID=A0A4U1MIS5_9BACL|nr:hypothetical protein [Pseudalkalibacillus hwajinpoensis]TKD71279.1 hypothetical protein FBF83_00255 [Pseudalkalibacillus hwajinpoensis]